MDCAKATPIFFWKKPCYPRRRGDASKNKANLAAKAGARARFEKAAFSACLCLQDLQYRPREIRLLTRSAPHTLVEASAYHLLPQRGWLSDDLNDLKTLCKLLRRRLLGAFSVCDFQLVWAQQRPSATSRTSCVRCVSMIIIPECWAAGLEKSRLRRSLSTRPISRPMRLMKPTVCSKRHTARGTVSEMG